MNISTIPLKTFPSFEQKNYGPVYFIKPQPLSSEYSDETDQMFKRAKILFWKCFECGHISIGDNPPNICPCCRNDFSFINVDIMN